MRIVVKEGRTGYAWWVLVARNGQTMATSETYANVSNARRAAKRAAIRLYLPVRA